MAGVDTAYVNVIGRAGHMHELRANSGVGPCRWSEKCAVCRGIRFRIERQAGRA